MPVARPSTANTMCLVLKPKEEVYHHNSPLIGSESEREAWRKNRVIQMKLGALLTEIHLQQESCARLMRTREYRFKQEADRRSNVPRSVEMVEQLNFSKQKHLLRARYTYGTCAPRDGYHNHHLHGISKHPPLSARPLRSHRQANELNRPKTSATIYRKTIDHNDLLDGPEGYDDLSVYRGDNKGEQEQIFDILGNIQQTTIPQPLRHTTELPAINIKDNFENIFPHEAFLGKASTPRRPMISIDAAKKVISESKAISLPKTPLIGNRPRKDSSSTSTSKLPPPIQRMNSVSKFKFPDPASLQEKLIEADKESVNIADTNCVSTIPDIDNETVVENFTENEPEPHDADNDINTTILAGNALTDIPVVSELKLDILDDNDVNDPLDQNNGLDNEFVNPVVAQGKKPVKVLSKKTSFNRVTTEPVMPLRHNITSVLRQERARYEANQLKVKDYIHKMSSRDTISRSNPRELSAQSRKSSARMNDSRVDSRAARKFSSK